jgi:serine/threonine protein kinase
VGPYKLLEQIGEGGMGAVWVASQSEPIKRKVAIKLIKPGMDSEQVLTRFEAERHALALMDHPNIARVLDAGITDQGRPFFAMEYVKGVPLTEYCDQSKLSLRDRLKLFLPICHALQHAHQKGIIHRDLKPSNILVCLYDGKPVPKVIDFGLAKAMHYSLTEQSIYTAQGMMLGTPLYMSPEQAEQNNLDIDTRTDVYALGVILYELLTGTTPLEKAQMKDAAYGEILRLIKEVEPPKPSTRLSGNASLPSVAAQRGIEPSHLTRQISGDLDWVVMKALEKDRSRRYETASGLAEDIGRHLTDEPVNASPPSSLYRLKKFARRNRVGVIAAGATAISLLLGIVGTTYGMLWALSERRVAVEARNAKVLALKDADQVSEFLTNVFRSPNPSKDGHDIRVVELLDRAAKQLDTDLADKPEQQQLLQTTLGRTYQGLGLYEQAAHLHEKVLAYRQKTLGQEHPQTLQTMVLLALSYLHSGRVDESVKLQEKVVRLRRKSFGSGHLDTVFAMNDLAVIYGGAGRAEDALKLKEQVLDLTRRIVGEGHPRTVGAMHNLGNAYSDAGRHEEAFELIESALDFRRQILGEQHPLTIKTLGSLARTSKSSDRTFEAIRLYEEFLTLNHKVHGADYPNTRAATRNLAALYESWTDAGHLDEVLQLREDALKLRHEVLGPDHQHTLNGMRSLGFLYSVTSPKKALPLLVEVSARVPKDIYVALRLAAMQVWFEFHHDYNSTRKRMLDWATDSQHAPTCEKVARLACMRPFEDSDTRNAAIFTARRAQSLDTESLYVPWVHMSLGMAEYRDGQYEKAAQNLATASRTAANMSRSDYRTTIKATAELYRAMCLFRQDQFDQAREVFSIAGQNMKPIPNDHENPLVDGANHGDLILWLAFREADQLINE